MNKRMIVYTLGKMVKIEGFLLILPFLISCIYQETTGIVYFGCAILTYFVGYLLSRKKPENEVIYAKEGFIIVALAWIVFSVIGALPFCITGEIPSYVDAFFEIVSGFTTTGSTILKDIEALSYASLFWRSFSHWIGGMGILVFVVAFLADAPGTTMHILKAEMPGPIVGKLVSKVHVTAKLLYKMYAVLTVIEAVFLICGGMPLFDSVLAAFSTAGTGGFAIKNASIAYYDSAYIDGVITVFMLLFGINFNLVYLVFIRRFKDAFKSEELHWYLAIVATATVLITINVASLYPSLAKAFRFAVFQVASVITTTGFVTADYQQWPAFSQTILILLMFIGACAGSTGGGIKVSRIVMMIKRGTVGLKQLVHPRSVNTIMFENQPVEDSTINVMHTYLILYSTIFIGSMLLVVMQNIDFASGFTAVATCMNNVGPGLNVVGPVENFSSLSDLSKLVLSFDMLAGRLEIFPMLMLFNPKLWKK